VLLAVVVLPLTGASTALACGDIRLATEFVIYDGVDGKRYIDGVITNNTSSTVEPDYIEVTSTVAPGETHHAYYVGDPLEPGDQTAFHVQWPSEVPTGGTTGVVGLARDTSEPKASALTVNSVSAVTTETPDGRRAYQVSVTNPNPFPMDDIVAFGTERDGGALVDALSRECNSFAGGETKTIKLNGMAPSTASLIPSVTVTGYEKPTVSISAETLSPLYGSTVRFTVELRHHDGSLVTGPHTLKLQGLEKRDLAALKSGRSPQCNDTWTYQELTTTTGIAVFTAMPIAPTYYSGCYYKSAGLSSACSDSVYVVPRVAAAAPTAPSSVKVGKYFKVKGRMHSGVDCLGKPIKIIAQRKVGRRWVTTKQFTASRDVHGTYKKSIKLTRSGQYRIKAYRAGVGYSKAKLVRARW
jgi:hypothetical protein